MNNRGFILGPVQSGDSFLTLPNPFMASNIGALVSPTESDALEVSSTSQAKLKAAKYNRSFALFVPSRIIPPHTSRSDLLEVKIARAKESAESFLLYTTHLTGYPRAYLDLHQLTVLRGEPFQVESVRRYGLEELVSDYNKARPSGLANCELALDGDGLQMVCAGAQVKADVLTTRAYQGQAIFNIGLAGACRIKLTKNVDGFTMRLAPFNEVVTSAKADEGGLIIGYRNRRDPRREHFRILETGLESDSSRQFDPQGPDIKSVSNRCSFEGVHELTICKSQLRNLRVRLLRCRNLEDYKNLKGDIAEQIIDRALRLLGCEEVADHPSDKKRVSKKSSRKGPDSLRTLPETGEVCLFEFKWWSDVSRARWDAAKQLMVYLERRHGIKDNGKVTGAYSALLDWNLESHAYLSIEKAC